VGQSATTDGLPDIVHAAVLTRLNLFSKSEREVLQIASINRTFARGFCLPGQEKREGALDGRVARDPLARASGESFPLHQGPLLDITCGTSSAGRAHLFAYSHRILAVRAGR
jgi:hypothetical protein